MNGKRKSLRRGLVVLPLLASMMWLLSALSGSSILLGAQSGGFELAWYSVDGGGGVSRGGAYTLAGSAGQPDAAILSGGAYTLAGGLWGGVAGPGATAAPPAAESTPTPVPPGVTGPRIWVPLVFDGAARGW